MMRKYKIIAVDFDGTLSIGKWPDIGEPNVRLIEDLKLRRQRGDKLILWTCRTNELLTAAVEWCRAFGLEFDAVNENLPEIVEAFGGDSRKIYADEYIDDKTPPNRKNEFMPPPTSGVHTPEDGFSDIAEMTSKQLLAEVNKAILTILAGGQSYKIGSLELTRASLARLYDMKKELEGFEDEGDGGIGRRTAVAFFGRR